MLLTTEHLLALDNLAASEAAGHAAYTIQPEQNDVYRVLELEGLAHPETGQSYGLTYEGREAARLLEAMRAASVLRATQELRHGWRFLGSEVIAALSAAERAQGRVGPLTEDLLRARGFAETRDGEGRQAPVTRLSAYAAAWLDLIRRARPLLEVTADLAASIGKMPPSYSDLHGFDIPGSHLAQMEAMELIAWSVPDGSAFVFTALGQAVREALLKGAYATADTVLDDAILSVLATTAEAGHDDLLPEQLEALQGLGYVAADGSLTSAGKAALRARALMRSDPASPPPTFTISRHEVELLATIAALSEEHSDQAVTKHSLHRVLMDRLERRYQDYVGEYGRTMDEVPELKYRTRELRAERREHEKAFEHPEDLDDLLVHLESTGLLHTEAAEPDKLYRLTGLGERVVQEQAETSRDISAAAVKAITTATTAGRFNAPATDWIAAARAESLIGSRGISDAGHFYAWLAARSQRLPSVSRAEARVLVSLPEDAAEDVRHVPGARRDDDPEKLHTSLDCLETRGLIERLVDGQIVRTPTGITLTRAVRGALELAYPITPSLIHLLVAIRQVGETLYTKDERRVRLAPHQWDEVERLSGLPHKEFQETVHLARLAQYMGDANINDAGLDLLEAVGRSIATT